MPRGQLQPPSRQMQSPACPATLVGFQPHRSPDPWLKTCPTWWSSSGVKSTIHNVPAWRLRGRGRLTTRLCGCQISLASRAHGIAWAPGRARRWQKGNSERKNGILSSRHLFRNWPNKAWGGADDRKQAHATVTQCGARCEGAGDVDRPTALGSEASAPQRPRARARRCDRSPAR